MACVERFIQLVSKVCSGSIYIQRRPWSSRCKVGACSAITIHGMSLALGCMPLWIEGQACVIVGGLPTATWRVLQLIRALPPLFPLFPARVARWVMRLTWRERRGGGQGGKGGGEEETKRDAHQLYRCGWKRWVGGWEQRLVNKGEMVCGGWVGAKRSFRGVGCQDRPR